MLLHCEKALLCSAMDLLMLIAVMSAMCLRRCCWAQLTGSNWIVGARRTYLHVCIEVSSAFMDSIKEQANRSMSVPGVFPWGSIPTPMRRTYSLFIWKLLAADGALFACLEVRIINDGDDSAYPWVLDNDPAQHGKAPLQDRKHGAEVLALLGNQVGQVVGRML